MRSSLPLLAALSLFILHAQEEAPLLSESIDALKATNRAKASPEKLAAYADGIKAVAAAGVVEKAAKAGDTAPDFTLQNSKGREVTLSEELKKGPVVLTWYRGGWCPYCNLQLVFGPS
jgi:hypothetical protein